MLAKGEGATGWAQGGIAAVLEPGDTFESHIEDTMIAGAGLNNRATVEFVVENAPAAIERLAELGVPVQRGDDSEGWHLTREGGHSHRRIVHVDDATGWAVQQALEKAAAANPNITLIPDMVAIDLVTSRHGERYSGDGHVWGVYALNRKSGRVETFTARATILATGGAGRVYLFSTAPRGATGDGIAMAWRAGCRVSNMEFMQFHPTCLYNLEVKNFLITEAVRGEGGQLKIPETGHRFMPDFDERAELAPRDVVARAIDHEIKRLGLDYVHLDISHRDAGVREAAISRTSTRGCSSSASTSPRSRSRSSRPSIIPAAAWSSISTGAPICPASTRSARSASRACTAPTGSPPTRCSNASCSATRRPTTSPANWDELPPPPPIRAWDESRVTDSDEEVVIKQNWTEIRRFMWNYVGIVRTTKRLERAQHRIKLLTEEIEDYYGHFRVTPGPGRAPQPAAERRADRPLRPPPQGKPRAALHAGLSEDAGQGGGYGACALADSDCMRRPREGRPEPSFAGKRSISRCGSFGRRLRRLTAGPGLAGHRAIADEAALPLESAGWSSITIWPLPSMRTSRARGPREGCGCCVERRRRGASGEA